MPRTPSEILQDVGTILLVDWPARVVPDTLTRAGFSVFDHGGPEPDNYNAFELLGVEVARRPLGRRPDHADLVFTHRPSEELAAIVASARELGARAFWWHTGLDTGGEANPAGCWAPDDEASAARDLAEAAGLEYVGDVYILDALAELPR